MSPVGAHPVGVVAGASDPVPRAAQAGSASSPRTLGISTEAPAPCGGFAGRPSVDRR